MFRFKFDEIGLGRVSGHQLLQTQKFRTSTGKKKTCHFPLQICQAHDAPGFECVSKLYKNQPFKILQILKIGNSTLQFSYQSPSTPSNSPPENPRDRHLVLPNLVGSEYMGSHHYLPPKKSNLGRKSHGSENLRFQALYYLYG